MIGGYSKHIYTYFLFLEISRVQSGGRPPGRENRLLDVYNEKPVRVTAKILVPVKEHPRVRITLRGLKEFFVIFMSSS